MKVLICDDCGAPIELPRSRSKRLCRRCSDEHKKAYNRMRYLRVRGSKS